MLHVDPWPYNGEDCENCNRRRVMQHVHTKQRLCEKCRWDPDKKEYVPEDEL